MEARHRRLEYKNGQFVWIAETDQKDGKTVEFPAIPREIVYHVNNKLAAQKQLLKRPCGNTN